MGLLDRQRRAEPPGDEFGRPAHLERPNRPAARPSSLGQTGLDVGPRRAVRRRRLPDVLHGARRRLGTAVRLGGERGDPRRSVHGRLGGAACLPAHQRWLDRPQPLRRSERRLPALEERRQRAGPAHLPVGAAVQRRRPVAGRHARAAIAPGPRVAGARHRGPVDARVRRPVLPVLRRGRLEQRPGVHRLRVVHVACGPVLERIDVAPVDGVARAGDRAERPPPCSGTRPDRHASRTTRGTAPPATSTAVCGHCGSTGCASPSVGPCSSELVSASIHAR